MLVVLKLNPIRGNMVWWKQWCTIVVTGLFAVGGSMSPVARGLDTASFVVMSLVFKLDPVRGNVVWWKKWCTIVVTGFFAVGGSMHLVPGPLDAASLEGAVLVVSIQDLGQRQGGKSHDKRELKRFCEPHF